MPIIKALPCPHNLNESQNTPGLATNLSEMATYSDSGGGGADVYGVQQQACTASESLSTASLSNSRAAFLHLQFKPITEPLFEIGILLH